MSVVYLCEQSEQHSCILFYFIYILFYIYCILYNSNFYDVELCNKNIGTGLCACFAFKNTQS